MQWLRDGLGIIEQAAETEGLAASLESNDGVYFVPALTGLGSPHWDPYARGTIVGLTRGTGRAHLARAALEAIAYQTVDAVRAQEAAAGERLEELRADGGAVVNSWLMQFQADVLGAPVIVPEIPRRRRWAPPIWPGSPPGSGTRSRWGRCGARRARYEPRMEADEREELARRVGAGAGAGQGLGGRWLSGASRRVTGTAGEGRSKRRARTLQARRRRMAEIKPQVYKDPRPAEYFTRFHERARRRGPTGSMTSPASSSPRPRCWSTAPGRSAPSTSR